jgi:hypothetical protein
MVDADVAIKGSIAMGVVFILLGSLVVPQFENTQDNLETSYESVTTTENWNDVINTSASSNYTVSGDSVTLDGSAGLVQTQVVETTDNHSTFEVNVTNLAADTDITLYNEAGTQLDTATASGDTSVTLSVTDYSADGYYLEFAAATATDAEVDGYESYGIDPIDSDVSILIYVTFLLFLVGLGLGIYARYQ